MQRHSLYLQLRVLVLVLAALISMSLQGFGFELLKVFQGTGSADAVLGAVGSFWGSHRYWQPPQFEAIGWVSWFGFIAVSMASALIVASSFKRVWLWAAFGAGLLFATLFNMVINKGVPSINSTFVTMYGLMAAGCVALGALLGWICVEKIDPLVVNADDEGRKTKTRLAKSYRGGFTLIELLTVIAIIAVLAAILFTVLGSSKHKARETEDINKLRQCYAAINLYEGDFDTNSPQSLAYLLPTYASKEVLWSSMDSRNGMQRSKWPANVWVNLPGVDRESDLKLYGPNMISFAYLKPFEARFQTGVTFTELRNNPQVGLLADFAVGACAGPCNFQTSLGAPPDHPAINNKGLLTMRTDGSVVTRKGREDNAGSFSYEQMFLFAPLL